MPPRQGPPNTNSPLHSARPEGENYSHYFFFNIS